MRRYRTGGRALIVGGSCDLAIGLAKEMTANALYPVLTYRNDRGKTRIDDLLHEAAGKYSSIPLDLSKGETFTALDSILSPATDYFVDFAHGDLEGLVASSDMESVAAYFSAHIANRAEVIQKVSRSMIVQRRGRMVYVSSAAAMRPNPGQGFYAAAKQASEAIYRNVGLELAGRGVTTVTLRPGFVDVGRGRRYLSKTAGTAMAKVPLGRALEIHEVVDAIMFLLSNSAVGFNATELDMTGGLTLGK